LKQARVPRVTPAPLVLAEPAILHADGRCTVWHSGAVIGPPGILVVNLHFDWVEPSDWRDHTPADAQPIHGYLEIPNHDPEQMLGDNGYAGGVHSLTYSAKFPGKVRGKSAFPPLTHQQVLGASPRPRTHQR
jgi:hypothetical protein